MADAVNATPERQASAAPEDGSNFTPINKEVTKAEPDVKVENNDKADSASPVPDGPEQAQPAEPTAVEPATPSKKAAKPKKAATPKAPKEPKTPKAKGTPAKRAADGEATPKSAKKAKATPGDRKTIPTSVAEMKEEDKMLMKWKWEGKPWGEINAEWERITGNKPASSTLPNRYNRLKAAVAVVEDEHVEQLKASLVFVDAAIEAEHKDALNKKWARVGLHMKENGVEAEYQASTLEKFWKKYEATNKSITPAVESAGTSGADEGDDAGESKEDE